MFFIDTLNITLQFVIQQTQRHLGDLAWILGLPCVTYFFTRLTGGRLLYLGIVPRTGHGLLGILFAPLLHANFDHLFYNLIPLLILSDFLLLQGWEFYLWVTASITLLSGLLIWCFARRALYVGASAVITGYWGFLVLQMMIQPNLLSVLLGFVCVYYFFGIFLGLFSTVSGGWQGHFFGLLAGLFIGYVVLYLL